MHSTMDSLQSFNPRSVTSNPFSKPRSVRFPSWPRNRSINLVLLCYKSKLFTSVPVHHTRFDPLHLIITSSNKKSTKINANSSRKQDSESSSSDITLETTSNSSEGIQKPANSSNAASESNSHSSNSSKKEKKWKNWWRRENRIRFRWEWKLIGQNQDVSFLLLQLAVSFLAFRMLLLSNSFSNSEQVNHISVPYSMFLSKINSNQVQKVEVDGVNIMFKLKSDQSRFSSQSTVESTRPSQEMEEAMRSAAPTKRILYTTTRPTDIKTPYEKMLENRVEFGSPDKRSAGFWNSVLVGFWVLSLLYFCTFI